MSKRITVTSGAAPLALASAALFAVAGCSSAAQHGGTTPAVAPPAVGAPVAPVEAAPATTPVTECRINDLAVALGAPLQTSAPSLVQRPIHFTNTGSSPCFVVGWPGVAALDNGGNQTYQAVRIGSRGSRITLQPGDSASAMFAAVTSLPPGPNCPNVPNLLVTAPDQTHSSQVAFGATICSAPAVTSLASGTNVGGTTKAQVSEAKQLWESGADATSANQGAYWTAAASLLSGAGYTQAAVELTQLTSLPDAMQTPTQQAEAHTDTTKLNAFFGTPGLYG